MGFLAGGNRKVLQPAGDRRPGERKQEKSSNQLEMKNMRDIEVIGKLKMEVDTDRMWVGVYEVRYFSYYPPFQMIYIISMLNCPSIL